MYLSRHDLGVSTTVRAHPVRLMILALALGTIAVTMIVSLTPWALLGIVLLVVAGKFAGISGRQVRRGVRAFFT